MKMRKTTGALIALLIIGLISSRAQNPYSIVSFTAGRDTIKFTITDDAKNLISGKATPVIDQDSLLRIIARADGIETSAGFNNQLYADVVRKIGSATISFTIKDGRKLIHQYNDGVRNVLENGSGVTKLFHERLKTYLVRVFEDSTLQLHYEVFRHDTLHHLRFFDENISSIYDQVDDIVNHKLTDDFGEYFQHDVFFVIDESSFLSYFIVSKKEINGGRSLTKVRLNKRHRLYIKDMPRNKVKTVVPLLAG